MTSEIYPGDMIKINRGWYKHWGICVGDGDMVHFAPQKIADGGNELTQKYSNDPDARIKIIRSNIKFWAGGDPYCADNYLDKQHKPKPVGDIVAFALHQVKFCNWDYNLVLRNCEKFAIWCRYRIDSIGAQAKKGLTAAAIAFGAVVLGVGVAAVASSSSETNRKEKEEYKKEKYLFS